MRSNWIVALKTAMEHTGTTPSKHSFHQVDFGNPAKYTAANGRETVKLPPTLRLKQVGVSADQDDDEFFRPFTGSVRFSGTMRLTREQERPTVRAEDKKTFSTQELPFSFHTHSSRTISRRSR